MRLSLAAMRNEVIKAETEREEDALRYGPKNQKPKWPPFNRYQELGDIPTLPEIKNSSAILCAKNERSSQEDLADVIICDETFSNIFLAYSTEKKAELFSRAILKLSDAIDQLKEHSKSSGSTLVASFAWVTRDPETQIKIHHILTLNIGDSRATVITRGPAKKCEATRLTCHHTPLRQHERDYLASKGFIVHEEENGFIITKGHKLIGGVSKKNAYIGASDYSNYSLQCSRTLGDSGPFQECELFSHEPSLSYFTSSANDCLILCSDGISDLISDENQAEIVESLQANFSASAVAAKITRLALTRKTKDNSTVLVTPLSEIPEGQVVFQFVADGHGGAWTAEFIKLHIMEYLTEAFSYERNRLFALRYLENPKINTFLTTLEHFGISVEMAEEAIHKELVKIRSNLLNLQPEKPKRTVLSFFRGNTEDPLWELIEKFRLEQIDLTYAYRKVFRLLGDHFKTLEEFGKYCSAELHDAPRQSP